MNLWEQVEAVELTNEELEQIERECNIRKCTYEMEREIAVKKTEMFKQEREKILSKLNIFTQAELLGYSDK